MMKVKFDADSLPCSLNHFECDGDTVHMPTQQCLQSPLTTTVNSSLFTHAHSSLSPWLPGYINGMQTILFILTLAGLYSG